MKRLNDWIARVRPHVHQGLHHPAVTIYSVAAHTHVVTVSLNKIK